MLREGAFSFKDVLRLHMFLLIFFYAALGASTDPKPVFPIQHTFSVSSSLGRNTFHNNLKKIAVTLDNPKNQLQCNF